MNREILFRGKCGDEWVYGDLRHLNRMVAIFRKGHTFPYEVDEKTVGQYTGLTDKNGVKIFEGDIVEFEDGEAGDIYNETVVVNRGVVAFSDGQFFVTNRVTVEMDDLIFNNQMDCVVIGNIYDNPEIMEV